MKKNEIEKKKQIKLSLNLAIIMIAIIAILIIIIISCIYMVIVNNSNTSNERLPDSIVESYDTNSATVYDEINGYCRIIGNNLNLLYKNEYETDTSYLEKLIWLNEETKEDMITSDVTIDVQQTLYIGAFEQEFINIQFGSDLSSDFKMTLAYMEDETFYNCTTNKIIKKAFDKEGNEVNMPEIDFSNATLNIPNNISIIYTLFDITTADGENYIVGMYDELFSDNNSNMLLITVVLKKENIEIDIEDNQQSQEFWETYANYEIETVNEVNQLDYESVDINGKTYYHRLTDNTWQGEFHQVSYKANETNANSIQEVVSYRKYIKYIDKIEATGEKNQHYTDSQSNYLILSYANGRSWCTMDLINCGIEDGKIIVYGDEEVEGSMADGSGYFIAIPTQLPVGTTVEYRECYSTNEISNLKNYGTSVTWSSMVIAKPIIYLYPTEDTEVSVVLNRNELITHSYPKYTTGWNVLAKTNGDLVDLDTGKNLYALYYESENAIEFSVEEEGFIVAREDTAEFLEEKLAILGLSDREAEEFIIYWLPKLEENNYNYIRFATLEEIEENMPLEITPNPDTLIRVLMTYKGLDEPIEVQEQQLENVERTGFVAVEWGGAEIK